MTSLVTALWLAVVVGLWGYGCKRAGGPTVLVSGLLVFALAAHHCFAVRTTNLTVWKGGGLGMFASADKYVRRLHVFADLPNGRRRELVVGSGGLARTVALQPSEQNLREAAEHYGAAVQSPNAIIHAQLWSHDLVAETTGQLAPQLVAEFTLERARD